LPLKDYLLFIDTEASGLPKKWSLTYSVPNNWPHAVQISWLIFTKAGEKIKEENHYINNNDFEMSPGALNIHGLTKDFLHKAGMPRRELLLLLSKDLQQYQPMVVGHFTELDYRIIGADYFREALENPMEKLRTFCIMKATQHLQQNPDSKFLRLGNLYELLFKRPLLSQHNAMVDATATAECFFELVKRKEIYNFTQPPILFKPDEKIRKTSVWLIAVLFLLISAYLIASHYG
jgi:DNA polymerase-3 subunit epsilon